MGLLDAAQAASNAAASTVSGPVDMLAWLLRKAGVNVGEPVGGSDWMKRKGLTKDVSPGASQVVGETLGLLAPTVAAAKAPQIAKGLLAAADNLAAPRTLNPQQGAIVWHGSPHKFDRFDSSKIGTGEGAQAYGHGLYLAESPEVAQAYQQALGGSKQRYTLAGKEIDRSALNEIDKLALNIAARPKEYTLAALESSGLPGSAVQKVAAAVNKFRGASYSDDPLGALYKVDLPDNAIARMLDWDKPLSQQQVPIDLFGVAQREVLRKLPSIGGTPAIPPSVAQDIAASKTGALAYKMLQDAYGPENASLVLRRSGVPGIRYLDGGSRGAGSGTSNFVVFPGEEGLLTILERNGVPLR